MTDGLGMFLQVYHGRPMLTGYVSRPSERQLEHVRQLQELLDTDPRAFVRTLRRLGVATVVLGPGTRGSTAAALTDSGLLLPDLRGGLRLSDARPTHGDESRRVKEES